MSEILNKNNHPNAIDREEPRATSGNPLRQIIDDIAAGEYNITHSDNDINQLKRLVRELNAGYEFSKLDTLCTKVLKSQDLTSDIKFFVVQSVHNVLAYDMLIKSNINEHNFHLILKTAEMLSEYDQTDIKILGTELVELAMINEISIPQQRSIKETIHRIMKKTRNISAVLAPLLTCSFEKINERKTSEIFDNLDFLSEEEQFLIALFMPNSNNVNQTVTFPSLPSIPPSTKYAENVYFFYNEFIRWNLRDKLIFSKNDIYLISVLKLLKNYYHNNFQEIEHKCNEQLSKSSNKDEPEDKPVTSRNISTDDLTKAIIELTNMFKRTGIPFSTIVNAFSDFDSTPKEEIIKTIETLFKEYVPLVIRKDIYSVYSLPYNTLDIITVNEELVREVFDKIDNITDEDGFNICNKTCLRFLEYIIKESYYSNFESKFIKEMCSALASCHFGYIRNNKRLLQDYNNEDFMDYLYSVDPTLTQKHILDILEVITDPDFYLPENKISCMMRFFKKYQEMLRFREAVAALYKAKYSENDERTQKAYETLEVFRECKTLMEETP